MSIIQKYQAALRHRTNPRYMTKDFIVPLYTGTEPDILDDSNTQRESSVYKEFPNDMPIVSPKEIQNQPYNQLELADGGNVERRGFKYGTRQELIDKMSKAGFDKYPSYLQEPHKLAKAYNIKTKISPGYKTRYSYDIPNDEKLSSILSTIENNRTSPRSGSFKKSQEILNNPKLKKEFIKFGSQQGVTGKQIREKYKISTAEFFQGGLRDLFDKNFQTDYRASVQPQTIERMKKILNNKSFNKLLNEGILPEHKDLKKILKLTPYEASTAVLRIGQAFTGQKFENIEDLNIPINKKAGKELLDEISKAPFNNPYSSAARTAVLNKIDSQMGNKTGTFDNFRKTIINNIKDNGLDKKLLKKFDLNEIAGVSAAANNKMAPYAYFVNLVNSKINQGELASFNNLYGRKTDELIKAVSQFKKTGDDTKVKEILNSFEESKNNFLNNISSKARKEIERVGLPGLSINSPEIEFGKRRINQLSKLGLNLPESFEKTGVTMTVPEGSLTLQDLSNNPELKTQMIANIGCPTINKSLGGRVNFSGGSNCYAKGLEKIESGNLNQTERRIASSFLKEAGVGEEIFQGVLKGTKIGLRFLQDATVGLGPISAAANVAISGAIEGPDLLRGEPNPISKMISSTTFGILEPGATSIKDKLMEFGSPETIKTLSYLDTEDKFNKKIKQEENAIENAKYTFAEYGTDDRDEILKRENNISLIKKQLDEFKVNSVKPNYTALNQDLLKLNKQALLKGIEGTKKTPIFAEEIKNNPDKSFVDIERYPNIYSRFAEELPNTNVKNIFKDYVNQEQNFIDQTPYIMKDKSPIDVTDLFKSLNNIDISDIDKKRNTNFEVPNITLPDDSMMQNQYNDGGRVGLGDGSGPKIGRRGFLGLIAGAAAAPDLIKSIKGTGKIASKIKFEKAEGMYPWFPDLVEKIKTVGKPFEEKEIIMEASYKHEAKGYGGLPKSVEKITRHVDGDTAFLLREYPDGRIAVDIHSPRNQEGSSTPVTLYYRPKMELKYYNGVQVEPAEFKVLEKEPRYFANGPDDVDIEMSEMRKIPGKDTIFGDIEAAERFATGNIKNRKAIPVKQSRREQMEDAPSDFIEETSPYGPETF